MWSLCTIWDLTYLLIALLLLSKVRIFFNGNLDGSLSRRTPLLIRLDFSLFIRSCNFPVWFIWPSDMYSVCVLFCLATRVFWLDFINGMDLYNGSEISFLFNQIFCPFMIHRVFWRNIYDLRLSCWNMYPFINREF